jgi:hypothetical protein
MVKITHIVTKATITTTADTGMAAGTITERTLTIPGVRPDVIDTPQGSP